MIPIKVEQAIRLIAGPLLVQSFKETLQYCDEWENSHQAVRQSVSQAVSQSGSQ